MTPTVFEILAQQYRDWHLSLFGVKHGRPRMVDADLASAKVAVVDVAFGNFEPGDYVLVWGRGSGMLPEDSGSRDADRLDAWPGPRSTILLLNDVQDHVRVIWERA